MRDIRFRAWDKDTKKMYDVISLAHALAEGGFDTVGIAAYQDTLLEGDEFELMQYTGLKDKNGVEIYEGDIVSFFDWSYWSRGEEWQQHSKKYYGKSVEPVVFEDGSFIASANYEYYNSLGNITQDKGAKLKVIGNIYENPELLNSA